jgi:hypothetical protein
MLMRWVMVLCGVGIWGGGLAMALAGPPDDLTVRFRSEPSWAMVSVDAKEACRTPCQWELYPGSHVIGMERDGFIAREEIIQFDKSETVKWTLKSHDGMLDVTTEPAGLHVVISRKGGGKQRKFMTPVVHAALTPGEYVVRLAEKDYGAQSLTVTVHARLVTEAVLEPVLKRARLTILFVGDEEEIAQVRVMANGRRLRGTGPWLISPGKERIVAKYKGRVLLDQTIELEKGAEVELELTVQEE